MAVIKAVSSKAGIGHAIDYVTKKEKTEVKIYLVRLKRCKNLLIRLAVKARGSEV